MKPSNMAKLHVICFKYGLGHIVGSAVTMCACAVFASAWQNATSERSHDLQSGTGARGWPNTSPALPDPRELSSDEAEGYGPPMLARVTADARRAALVAPSLSGQLDTVFVAHGDEVKRGAPLFRVRSVELSRLQAERSRAARAVEQSQHERERLRAAGAQQPLALARMLAADARAREAERALATAEAKLRTLHLDPHTANHQTFVVRAPLSGTVVESMWRPGEALQARQPVLYIADTRDGVFLEVDVHVPQSHALEVGAPARVTLRGMERSEPLYAHIEAISDVVNRRDNTVRVQLAAKDERLQINDMLEVQLPVHRSEAQGVL